MKASTGLKTINGVTRHTPRIMLTWDECQEIQGWLPQGGTLSVELDRAMVAAKERAEELNHVCQIPLST
jgi:hypothetical protein